MLNITMGGIQLHIIMYIPKAIIKVESRILYPQALVYFYFKASILVQGLKAWFGLPILTSR